MRLARFEHDRETWVGRVEGDNVVPLAPGFGAAGQDALVRFAVAHSHGAGEPRPAGEPLALAEVRLLAPVPQPPSIRDFYAFEAHVEAARRTRGLDMEPAWYEAPAFYFSNSGAVFGPYDTVAVPPGCSELDYELEVAAVIGYPVRDCSPEEGFAAIAGFTLMNDWSARDIQRREMRVGLGPSKAKDFATSLGPVLVTSDDLPDAASGRPSAALTGMVNGQPWSSGELSDIYFSWGEIVAHAASGTWLRAGDVLGSGTVGTGCILELSAVHGAERYPWLTSGDVVELHASGIGALVNTVG